MVSNRVLAGFVIGAVAVSVFGVVFSLGLFSDLQDTLHSTGYASSGQGEVQVTFPTTLSITTSDSDTIAFSGCAPGGVIYSNVTGGNAAGDCGNFTPGEILLRNDGSYEANVTLEASGWGEAHGGSFLNSSTDDSWVAYKVSNASSHSSFGGGCAGAFPQGWVNITDGNETVVCDYLLPGAVNNSVEFDIAIFIPEDVGRGENNLSFTFWASAVI